MDTSETTPEFDIFERIKEVELTLPEVKVVAKFAFAVAFYNAASRFPNPRLVKDEYLDSLSGLGLRKELVDSLGKMMVGICEVLEESKK